MFNFTFCSLAQVQLEFYSSLPDLTPLVFQIFYHTFSLIKVVSGFVISHFFLSLSAVAMSGSCPTIKIEG